MNLKNKVLALGILCALGLPQAAGAEGFAINEWSAEGVAMGGARMFAEGDAANVAYNPASITKVDGEAFKVSATYLSPHGEYDLYKGSNHYEGKNRVHFGFAPGTYYVKKLNDKDWFGIGAFSRFAMVSEFERNEIVSTNAFVSRLDGVSITPTFAHKFDDKWSAAVGAEINYVRLTMEKNTAYMNGMGVGPTHTKGESYALGWNAAANYAFDDKNEIGVVYRSRIKHSMEADFKGYSIPNIGNVNGDAYGEVTLPESWHIGYSHKFNDKTRVELNAVRTGWDTYKNLDIMISDTGKIDELVSNPKNWEDGWRYAIGVEHKLSDKYTVMAGFAYDESSIPYDGGDFMVPTGNRKTYSIGARYNDKDQTLAIALGWMDVGDLQFKFRGGDYNSATDGRAHTHDSYTKIIGISYQRNF
ncbi:outer membrane protein transport protein [Phascolarctobacterium faecium]|nr:outer membrane protein transport protein [Phascolarctobacterium faecium]MDM8109089.1 outer membrane protein transport protein [Phascolarctobacterium faecium]